MNCGELILKLQKFPADLNVYVPDLSGDGTVNIAFSCETMKHLNTEDMGISIPDDVIILALMPTPPDDQAKEEG